ncbi:GTP cyclohydrolase II [Ktedonosporobacter rubrisoli]|uniref:GTP cyclohydrolase-2 n=1 Tax=Ktedonosporobacter rubrisoli TaxID=2509675 RepID=A0A4P6K4R4_KTERU|nr:GTP cyclohydrolase II [Ktedonosporobacter rubrisoli]
MTVDAVARYRQEHRVSFITETHLPTSLATFQLRHYQEVATGLPYLALLLGDMHQEGNVPLLRLHSACATGDIFGSQRCDCQAQLHAAMVEIAREGRGVLLYLPQEGRGIGLGGKLQAYALQEQGFDTIEANELLGYPADARDYSTALEILRDLGLQRVRLLTNNPDKLQALQAGGIQAKRVPLEITPGASNLDYLQTKQRRFGHMLDQSLALYREADKARSYGKSHHA